MLSLKSIQHKNVRKGKKNTLKILKFFEKSFKKLLTKQF